MRGRGGVMAGIILRVQVDAGRADVGMSQVVPHHFEIHLVAQMAASRVPQPVGGCLFQVGRRRYPSSVPK